MGSPVKASKDFLGSGDFQISRNPFSSETPSNSQASPQSKAVSGRAWTAAFTLSLSPVVNLEFCAVSVNVRKLKSKDCSAEYLKISVPPHPRCCEKRMPASHASVAFFQSPIAASLTP